MFPSALLFTASVVAATAVPHPRILASRNLDASKDPYKDWPTYEELPLHPSFPTKAAWGVWGADDDHGALNHITPETIRHAASEIQLGLAFSLNLQLDLPGPPPNPNRKPLTHLFQPGDGYTDDVVVMNTQISTQFDGLRHFPYSTNNSVDSYQWYNDLIATYDEVIGPSPTTVLGLQMSAEKGIAVRAVLLDWAGWMDANNRTFDAFGSVDITASDLDKVAAWQGLPESWSRPGDVLLIRSGWLRQYKTLNATEDVLLPIGDGYSVGMEASDASTAWLWEKKLSIVGADNPAFESVGSSNPRKNREWLIDIL